MQNLNPQQVVATEIRKLSQFHHETLFDMPTQQDQANGIQHVGRLWRDLNVYLATFNDYDLKSAVRDQGGLKPNQYKRLLNAVNSYAQLVSKHFNRHFSCHSGAILTVDCIAFPKNPDSLPDEFKNLEEFTPTQPPLSKKSYEKSALFLLRPNGTKPPMLAFAGGGIVDYQESFKQTAKREFKEETEGCKLKNCDARLIWDTPRGGPEHRISKVFSGTFEGVPQKNDEAKGFKLIRKLDIPYIPQDRQFAKHLHVLDHYFDLVDQNIRSLDIKSKDETFDHDEMIRKLDLLENSTVLKIVADCLDIVEELYQEQGRAFVEWANQHLKNNSEFQHAIRTIQDFGYFEGEDLLWTFLKNFKLCAKMIGALFDTPITTSEGGLYEIAAVIEKKQTADQPKKFVLLRNSEDKYEFPKTEHRAGEAFKQTLHRVGYESVKVRVQDDQEMETLATIDGTNYKNERGCLLHMVILKTFTNQKPKKTLRGTPVILSAKEILQIPSDEWNMETYPLMIFKYAIDALQEQSKL